MSSEDHPDWWRPIGGQNSQDSILERRSLIWNDNEVETPDAPPAFYTCAEYKGKFFTRGCRGMIESIQIYCRDAGVNRITLRYSPHPCLGPFGEVDVTPLAGWSWVDAVVEDMWNYDSLFIWVHNCVAGVDWGYDTDLPYDGHESPDTGATWSDMAIRPFIRVVYTGETPGDVPVSGIINNIQIPNVSSTREYNFETEILQGVDTQIIGPIEGAGYVDLIILDVVAAPFSHNTIFNIRCDNQSAFWAELTQLNAAGIGPTTPRLTMTQYGADARCSLVISKKFEFRREFDVYAVNSLGPQAITSWTLPTLLA